MPEHELNLHVNFIPEKTLPRLLRGINLLTTPFAYQNVLPIPKNHALGNDLNYEFPYN